MNALPSLKDMWGLFKRAGSQWAKAGEDVVVKIGDYGLAKAFDLAGMSGLSATGAAAGTPVFMPRQQLIDYKYAKPPVDVWAMAASLYYMLTLKYPRDFEKGKDPWQIVLQTDAIPGPAATKACIRRHLQHRVLAQTSNHRVYGDPIGEKRGLASCA